MENAKHRPPTQRSPRRAYHAESANFFSLFVLPLPPFPPPCPASNFCPQKTRHCTSRQMSQHEHMLYPAPPPRRMSSQAAFHVTSPTGDTSEEYEVNVYSPTHRSAPAPPMPSHSSPKNAREVVSPITRVCSQCQHDGPPVWVADTSCVTCCCHVMCISLLVLFALLGQRSRGKIVHHTLVLVM